MIRKFKKWLRYHNTRRRLKRGDRLVSSFHIGNDFSLELIQEMVDTNKAEEESKYNLPLFADWKIGEVNDNFYKDLKTVRITLYYRK